MEKISPVKYNKMHCTRCGEFTTADLVAFNFSKLFALAIENTNDETWQSLVRLDLKFYYTIRDICQEMHYVLNTKKLGKLNLTVRQVIKQLEFLMKPATFEEIKNNHRNSHLYNNLFETISSNHSSFDEKMADIEKLVQTLMSHQLNDVIISIPLQIILDKDDLGNEMPIGIRYVIGEKIYEDFNRVCPRCGEVFDGQAGYYREYIIGLAGLARVGKTAYIASLIDRLKKFSDDNFISIAKENYEKNESFIKFNDEIVSKYHQGQIISKTAVENTDEIPLVYLSLKIKGEDYNFVFVDMPGEVFDSDGDEGIDFISEKRHILKSADAIWCCVEPAMFNNKYHNLKYSRANNTKIDQLANLANTLNNLYPAKTPACIIVTQSDLLKNDYPNLYQPQTNVMQEYLIEGQILNLNQVNEFVSSTRDFVKQMLSFEATIGDIFEGFSMFSIASYGYDVNDDKLTGQNIAPSMVELPFIWTLASLGCLEAKKINVNKNIFGKEKETIEDIIDKKELYI